MKNSKLLLQRVVLGLLLNAACALVGQPAQAQLRSIHNRSVPPTPERVAANEQQGLLDRAAAASLHAGRYAQAEADARQALSLGLDPGVANEVLGAALGAQGKEQEALQVYRALTINGKDGLEGQTRNLLPYALLLLKSGRWEQAVAAYNAALPHLGDGQLIQATSRFSLDVPEPTALAVALHIARGLTYNGQCDWAGESQNKEAMAEYGKALQLAPDSPLVNYYYGIGWQKLSPAERAKSGSEQQAKAALQKAIQTGKSDVKKAALKALKGFNKPA